MIMTMTSDPFSHSSHVKVITSVQRRRRWTTAERAAPDDFRRNAGRRPRRPCQRAMARLCSCEGCHGRQAANDDYAPFSGASGQGATRRPAGRIITTWRQTIRLRRLPSTRPRRSWRQCRPRARRPRQCRRLGPCQTSPASRRPGSPCEHPCRAGRHWPAWTL